MPGQYLSTRDKEKIVEAREKGIQRKDVAALFKCSEKTVSVIVGTFKTTGSVHRASKSGRPPITTPREDKGLVKAHKNNKDLNASDGVVMMKSQFGKDISRMTVSRRLIRGGLVTRRAAKKPLMNAKHRKIRLEFAKKYDKMIEQM